jgi:Tfp pilus assembly protein PilO
MSKVLGPFLFLTLAIGLVFVYIRPAYDVLLATQAQADKLNEVIANADALFQQRDTLHDAYLHFKPLDKARMNMILPDTLDVVRIIVDMDALAQANHIDITTIDLQHLAVSGASTRTADTPEDPVTAASFSIKCTGSYGDFKTFLQGLETSLALVDVTDLTISANTTVSETSKTQDLTYALTLRTYYLK